MTNQRKSMFFFCWKLEWFFSLQKSMIFLEFPMASQGSLKPRATSNAVSHPPFQWLCQPDSWIAPQKLTWRSLENPPWMSRCIFLIEPWGFYNVMLVFRGAIRSLWNQVSKCQIRRYEPAHSCFLLPACNLLLRKNKVEIMRVLRRLNHRSCIMQTNPSKSAVLIRMSKRCFKLDIFLGPERSPFSRWHNKNTVEECTAFPHDV